jgi:flagellar protein FlaG
MSSTSSVASSSQAMLSQAATRPSLPNLAEVSSKRSGAAEAAGELVTAARSSSVPSVHESAKVSRETVQAAASKIQSFVSSMSRDLSIHVDSSSGKAVIQVVDPQSNETVRQIPGEEALRLARTIDYLSSLLVNQKA